MSDVECDPSHTDEWLTFNVQRSTFNVQRFYLRRENVQFPTGNGQQPPSTFNLSYLAPLVPHLAPLQDRQHTEHSCNAVDAPTLLLEGAAFLFDLFHRSRLG